MFVISSAAFLGMAAGSCIGNQAVLGIKLVPTWNANIAGSVFFVSIFVLFLLLFFAIPQ